MSEVWKTVCGYEGRYEVCAHGEVRSLRCKTGARVRPVAQVIASDCYLAVSLYDGKRSKTHPVHVVVARAFLGPRPQTKEINHVDGVKSNNAAANLEYCTRHQNMQHAVRLGLRLAPNGAAHPRAKLDDAKVLRIRELLQAKVKGTEVAKMMNVKKCTISSIKLGRTWAHISAPVAAGE